MSLTVIVNGPVTADIDKVDTKQTAGAFADELARAHGVAGDEFSLKVNGDVLRRTAPMGGVGTEGCVELVEVTDYTWTDAAPAAQPAPEPAPVNDDE